jgi:hypothetical protein
MAEKEAQQWFKKELNLINPGMSVRWHNKVHRWCIHNEDGSVSHIVQHPITKEFRDLDRRILRKLQIDQFFTHNDLALQIYVDSTKEESEVNYELRQHLTRGLDGISDYLSGWDKD